MIRNIVLVKQGGWGQVTKPEYEDFISYMKRNIEKIESNIEIKFDVVDSLDDIKDRLTVLNDIHTLIFISRSEIETARKIRKQYSHINNVIVLTGLIPDDEILIIEKPWLTEGLLKWLVI